MSSSEVIALARAGRTAARSLAVATTAAKNAALLEIADHLERSAPAILKANAADLEDGRQNGLSKALLDRLALDPKRVAALASAVREVAALPDPVGAELEAWTRPNGLKITKRRVPIGLVGMIYESRPNVTTEAASLCLKSGNACLLRGGKEAFRTNTALAAVVQEALAKSGLPKASVQLVPTTDRKAVEEMCALEGTLDLLIPRGGPELIRTVSEKARMPVLKHGAGVCHVYVDAQADLAMAEEIAFNAKVSRPGVCNAMETMLVHASVADVFLGKIVPRFEKAGVELRGDDACRKLFPAMKAATVDDWRAEYLDLVLAVRVVPSAEEAMEHVEHYGSRHSDAIVTRDEKLAERFLASVDSAAVYWNASTRFTDGGEFGFGAEIGISTDKVHARGPMGLNELCTYKFELRGDGQVR
jgi:glutamate-5-semialdehyde dehydrogenase